MANTRKHPAAPWIFGSFAIYAPSMHAAEKVYERIKDEDGLVEPFGTEATASGIDISWINTRYLSSSALRG